MLSDGSYMMALYVYCGAAVLFVLCFGWFLLRRWRGIWALMLVCLAAALMLTPAFPREGVDTLAPALVVAGFQLATEGREAAQHALRPLATMCAVALGVALLLRVTLFRARSRNTQPESQSGSPAE